MLFRSIWLRWVLVAARRTQFPDQGSNPGPLHWKLRALSHWTTREVPVSSFLNLVCVCVCVCVCVDFFHFGCEVCCSLCPNALFLFCGHQVPTMLMPRLCVGWGFCLFFIVFFFLNVFCLLSKCFVSVTCIGGFLKADRGMAV